MIRRPFYLLPPPRVEWHYLVRILALLVACCLILLISGCGQDGPEIHDIFTVTATDWYTGSIIAKYDDGAIKTIHQCPDHMKYVIQVWPGQRFAMVYHWNHYDDCYVIDRVVAR